MLTALPDIIQDCSHIIALDSVDMMHADLDTAGQAGELPGRHAGDVQLHELQQLHLGQVALGEEGEGGRGHHLGQRGVVVDV